MTGNKRSWGRAFVQAGADLAIAIVWAAIEWKEEMESYESEVRCFSWFRTLTTGNLYNNLSFLGPQLLWLLLHMLENIDHWELGRLTIGNVHKNLSFLCQQLFSLCFTGFTNSFLLFAILLLFLLFDHQWLPFSAMWQYRLCWISEHSA